LTNRPTSDGEPKEEESGPYDEWPTPALLRFARSTYVQATHEARAEAGFEDVPRNGGYVLAGMVNRGASASSVVDSLGVTKQAASQLIDTLALRGYVERVPDPTDRRRMMLEPTERGRAAAIATRDGVETIDRELAARLSPAEQAVFRAGLVALVEIGEKRKGRRERVRDEEEKEEEAKSSPARLLEFNPIFRVKDLRRALEHYRSLGFTVDAYEDGEDYGFAVRDGVSIHLAADQDYDPRVSASQAYLFVDDADALAAEWGRPGIGGRTLPASVMAYKIREGRHTDPDSNVIRFGSRIREDQRESDPSERGA
jgi:DNA-binding MarR family transcriptional regulator